MAALWEMKLNMNNDIPVAFKLTNSRLNSKHVKTWFSSVQYKIRWVFRVSPPFSDDLINLKWTMVTLQTTDADQESQQEQASEWIRGCRLMTCVQ